MSSKKPLHNSPEPIPQPAPRVDQDGVPHEPTDQLDAKATAPQSRDAKRGHLQGLVGKVGGVIDQLDKVHAELDDSAVMDRIHAAVVALNMLRETADAILKGAHPGGKPGEQPPLEDKVEEKPDEEAPPEPTQLPA